MADRLSGFTGGQEFEERERISRFAVLISDIGTGSNLQALIDASENGSLPQGSIKLVISDSPEANGLLRAGAHGVPAHISLREGKIGSPERNVYSQRLAEFLNINGITVAVMAGFGTIVSDSFHEIFNGVSVNVHPGAIPDNEDTPLLYPDGSPIPWNQGRMTEKAVANFLGQPSAHCTVHVVTRKTDFGPVLARGETQCIEGDTVKLLYGRLKLEEHKALIESLKDVRRIYELAGKALPLF